MISILWCVFPFGTHLQLGRLVEAGFELMSAKRNIYDWHPNLLSHTYQEPALNLGFGCKQTGFGDLRSKNVEKLGNFIM